MDLLNFLTCLPLFKDVDEAVTRALAAELEKKELPAGTVLFAQGDPADAFYIVTSGRLRVTVHSGPDLETNSDLGTGDCIGEMSLLTGQPRTATITAVEDSQLLGLAKPVFDTLVQAHPNLLSGLASQLLPRFQRDQINIALTRLFGKLDEGLLRDLLGRMGWRRLDSGKTLFQQGEPGDEMYIVVQGRLRFVDETAGGCERFLGEVGAGECIGEFALLAEPGTPEGLRTATVYATRQTDMIVVSRKVFEDLLCQYPQALLNLTRQIVRRSTAVGKHAVAPEANMVVTLLPVRPGQDLGRFSGLLADSLSAFGPALTLTAGRFEELYGKAGASGTPLDHPLSPVIDAWLDEREREHAFTLYDVSPALDASGRLTAWTQRCVEDADVLLLVGEAGTNAGPGAVELALPSARSRSRLELVLLHPADCQAPSGTAAWLELRRSGPFPAQACHHVRLENPADFRRMARRIAGKPVGLTLSGGGARGWAHVGVLRALEEAELEFDWVAGASMGAIVAAGCALDWSSERLCELAARFSDPRKLLDYTFPYASITTTRHITHLLRDLYGEGGIEDTWHPFFCVSADLNHGEERMHMRGPLWKAVRASMAFPGIFAPVSDEGCVLIDGGAANNLPVDRMRELCPTGTVLGVELVTGSPVRGEYDFGPSLSGWQVLFAHLSPASKRVRVPTILNIIDGLVYGANRYRLNEVWRCADRLVKVPVQTYGLLEFDKYEQIIEAGYQAAREQLQDFHP
jgi:predicted acylesterase/phospholipase RssA/CRP-like cAMP-binding protein